MSSASTILNRVSRIKKYFTNLVTNASSGPYNAQRLIAESPERLERRNILVAQKQILMDGLHCFHEHVQKYQAQSGSAPVAAPSNYHRPSVSDLQGEDMKGVHSHGLPHRSMNHRAV